MRGLFHFAAMAIGATTTWRIRVSGSNLNGGGYDSAIASAGTDYTDQDAAQLSLTDLATTGVTTTLTSVTGGFTSAMIGNCIRIASGTNFTPGYYFIVTRVDTNTVTLDRACTSAAGVAGVGKIGGAFALFEPLMGTGNGGLSTPAITSPLAAGHTIYVRGAGTDDPTTVDYDYKGTTTAGYYSANANGSVAAGRISVVGYNGRPLIQHSGLLFFQAVLWHLENLKFKNVASSSWTTHGIIGTPSGGFGNSARNIISDLNGNDGIGLSIFEGIDIEIRNSGGGAAGTGVGIYPEAGAHLIGCYVHDVRGDGFASAGLTSFDLCVADTCGRDGFRLLSSQATYPVTINQCVAYGCGSDGVELTTATAIATARITNSIFANNGGYGINCSTGATALNDRLSRGRMDYNDFYSNTSGARNAISAGAHDLALDPQFVDAPNGDFRIGTNLKAAGFPGAFRGSAGAGYLDMGAVQRQESGGGLLLNSGMVGGLRG